MKSSIRLISSALRLAALGARFLLFFVLALYLPANEVGVFGLISATINYAAAFVGIDFYQYSNRELRQSPKEHHISVIHSSILLYCVMYVVAIPLFSIAFHVGLIDWSYFYIAIGILILEHAGQELYRILVMLEKPIVAGATLFLRLGFWVFALACAMYLNPESRNIETVLWAWWLGTISAFCLALRPILALTNGRLPRPMGKAWLFKGLRASMPLLVGTLCLRATVTFDRYLMEIETSRELLGVYVFFAGMAAALPAILEAGVFSFRSPKLISAAQNPISDDHRSILMRILIETIIVSILFLGASILAYQFIGDLMSAKTYSENLDLLLVCVVSQIALSLSNVFHFAIYGMRLDKHIIMSNVFGLISFLASFHFFSIFFDRLSVPLALVVCNTTVLTCKCVVYLKYSNARSGDS